jgi:hypothetical protein
MGFAENSRSITFWRKANFVDPHPLSSSAKRLAFNISLTKLVVNIRLNCQIFSQNRAHFILKKIGIN